MTSGGRSRPIRKFYRLVPSAQPTEQDFRSDKALGEPRPGSDPELIRMWEGVSATATEAHARSKRRDLPWLGRDVAVLAVAEGGSIAFRRTGRGRGHHTRWGDPQELLGCVVDVLPVAGPDARVDTE